MSKVSKAQRDVLLLTAGRIGAAGLSFIWLLIAARELGPATFGRLMTLLSLGMLASAFHDGGHAFALTESVARDHRRLASSVDLVVRRRVVLGGVAVVAVGVVYAATFSWEWSVSALFGVSIVATAVYTTITAGLRGAELIVPDAVNEFLSRIFIVAIGVPMLLAGGGLLGVVVVYGITDALSAVVLVVAFKRLTSRSRSESRPPDHATFEWRNLLPLGATVVVGTIAYRVDVWMVAALRNSTDAGLYGAAYRLQEGVFIPAAALVAARIASLVGAPTSQLSGRVRRLGGLTFAAALLPALAVAVFAGMILEATFGTDYDRSIAVLRLLLLSTPVSAVVIVVIPALASRVRTRAMQVVVVGAIANVVANLVLIPRWGPSGAATATLIAQTMVAVVAAAMLRRVISTSSSGEGQMPAASSR